jgi:hypothetical protein
MTSSGSSDQAIRLEVVGAGNAWWVSPDAGPASISTYVFLDVEQHPDLLALPERAAEPGWLATAHRLDGGRLIRVEIAGSDAAIEIPTDHPQLESVRRARTLYLCPTTPRLGIDPRLARDRSVPVEVAGDA